MLLDRDLRLLWGRRDQRALKRDVSAPASDSLPLIYSVQAPSSPSSPSANEPKYEKRWLDAVSLPLFMARISRRKAGTDKLRYGNPP